MIFEYGEKEMTYLKKKDKKLGEAIDRIGRIKREIIPDVFTALVNSIIAQQISGKAAETVWNRFCQLAGRVTPENIAALELEQIQSCGMSLRKAGYIKEAAAAGMSGIIDFQALPALSDNEIINAIVKLHGIGVWTAEMLLIFSLCRPDVVSFSDFGIRKGMMKLYNLKELTKEKFQQYQKRYSPYGTTASFYLWAIAAE